MKKIILRINLIIIAFMFVFASAVLVSCDSTKTCTEHVDANKDGKCDVCSEVVPCTEHVDENKDGQCDVCGDEVPCTEHVDENKDGQCDVCGDKVPCAEHVDEDDDYQCDICGETYYPELAIEEVYKLLENSVPKEITDNVTLPSRFDDCSAVIYWQSSDNSVIDYRGRIKRSMEDIAIKLTAEIRYPTSERYYYDIDVIVKGITLKPIENKKIISAYLYASSGFSGINEADLEKIDYINYSFASVVGGKVYLIDSQALRSILAYRNRGVRVGLAIGGWGADGFSDAVATAESRTIFAESIIDIMEQYGFDGIDIDWEYPTSTAGGIKARPEDKANLTLFCKELYPMIKNYRSDALFTMAVAANTCFDFAGLTPYVDYFNLMTYDYSIGSTSALHHTNLYSSSASASSVDYGVNRLLNWGVPANKIIIGAAFYGRYATFASKYSMNLGSALSTNLSTTLSYTNIVERINSGVYQELWDDTAKASYIIKTSDDGGFFVTFDSKRSVTCKCEYVLAKDLGGIMFWELTQDKTGDLVTTMDEVLNTEK